MTESRYGITLVCAHVPEELEGVPVPLEIVPAAGAPRRLVLELSEGRSWREPVAGPGRYFVRAELPSGQWIGETATVEETPQAQPDVETEVTLDFGAEEALSFQVVESVFRSPSLFASRPLSVQPVWTRNKVIRGTAARADDAPIPLTYGVFETWADPPDDGLSRTQTLRMRRVGRGITQLPGRFTLSEHPGAGQDTTKWRPLLVQLSTPEIGSTVLVWPPSQGEQTLELVPDPETRANPHAPPLLAFWTSGDRLADALFSYVRGNRMEAARQTAPALIRQAERFLQMKAESPLHATLAAYVLLKTGHRQQEGWIANLGRLFPHLPDGAVIHGWFLILAGKAEEAPEAFRAALARGVPMYSEGVRLLRDGFGFLRGLYPDDPRIRAEAERADRIASAANFESELTCLRLGKELLLSPDPEISLAGSCQDEMPWSLS